MARGSPPRYTKCPKPGTFSPRRSSSATTRGTSSGPLAAAISVSAPRDAPPCRAPLIAPRPVPTTAYGSARTEAAARAASVEAASSWSASSTSAADSARSSPGPGRRSQSRDHSRPATGSDPRPAPALGVPGIAERRGQAVHHAGDDVPPGREHGRLVELEPERIGRRHGRDDHLEPLERQGPGGQRGLRGPARRQRRGPRLPRFPRGPELAGPEQLGDLLEGPADREAGRVQPAEPQAVTGDLGDGRLDRDVRDPGGPPRPAPPGQPLDLLRAEQAGPPVRGLDPAQHAAADVRVEGGGLDAEPPGGLCGGQEVGHALPPRFVRNIEFNQY